MYNAQVLLRQFLRATKFEILLYSIHRHAQIHVTGNQDFFQNVKIIIKLDNYINKKKNTTIA